MCGAAAFVVVLHYSGRTIVDSGTVAMHQSRLSELERANRELTDRLFALGSHSITLPEGAEQPYDERSDARAAVLAARRQAVAEELGVDLSRGIPVAIFFGPDGKLIGTTNDGQLEPARRYSSKQILRFMRDIAERSRITVPDSVGP
jgi:hypothetical protein